MDIEMEKYGTNMINMNPQRTGIKVSGIRYQSNSFQSNEKHQAHKKKPKLFFSKKKGNEKKREKGKGGE